MFVACCLLVACLVQADQTVFRDLDLEAARALAADQERLLLVAFVEPGAELVPEFEALFEEPGVVDWIEAQAIAIRLVEAPGLDLAGMGNQVSWQPSLTVVAADGESFTRVESWQTDDVVAWLEASRNGNAVDDYRSPVAEHEYRSLSRAMLCQHLLQEGLLDQCAEMLLSTWDQYVTSNRAPQWDPRRRRSPSSIRVIIRVTMEEVLFALNYLEHGPSVEEFFERLVRLEINLRNGTRSDDPEAWDDWMSLAKSLNLRDRLGPLLLARDEPLHLIEWDFSAQDSAGHAKRLAGPSGYRREELYGWALADPRQSDVLKRLPDIAEFSRQRLSALESLLEAPLEKPDASMATDRFRRILARFENGDERQKANRQAEAQDMARSLARAWAACIVDQREADARDIAQSFGETTASDQIRKAWFDEAARWTDVPSELPFPRYGVRDEQ